MPPPSATAARFAAHWVADALAGDETRDFSVIKGNFGFPAYPNPPLRFRYLTT